MKIERFDVSLSKQSEKPYTGGETVQVGLCSDQASSESLYHLYRSYMSVLIMLKVV